jgi:hypothetical protein
MAIYRILFFCVVINFLFIGMLEAKAQEAFEDRHIRITADRPAIIPLNEEASSVIIGNPAHATAVLDSANTLIVNPLRPGATSLIVLNENGEAVLEKQLLINPPAKNYVRVNRICSASANEQCRSTSLYYCAGGCYEMILPEEDASGSEDADDAGDVEEPSEEGQPANAVSEGYIE